MHKDTASSCASEIRSLSRYERTIQSDGKNYLVETCTAVEEVEPGGRVVRRRHHEINKYSKPPPPTSYHEYTGKKNPTGKNPSTGKKTSTRHDITPTSLAEGSPTTEESRGSLWDKSLDRPTLDESPGATTAAAKSPIEDTPARRPDIPPTNNRQTSRLDRSPTTGTTTGGGRKADGSPVGSQHGDEQESRVEEKLRKQIRLFLDSSGKKVQKGRITAEEMNQLLEVLVDRLSRESPLYKQCLDRTRVVEASEALQSLLHLLKSGAPYDRMQAQLMAGAGVIQSLLAHIKEVDALYAAAQTKPETLSQAEVVAAAQRLQPDGSLDSRDVRTVMSFLLAKIQDNKVTLSAIDKDLTVRALVYLQNLLESRSPAPPEDHADMLQQIQKAVESGNEAKTQVAAESGGIEAKVDTSEKPEGMRPNSKQRLPKPPEDEVSSNSPIRLQSVRTLLLALKNLHVALERCTTDDKLESINAIKNEVNEFRRAADGFHTLQHSLRKLDKYHSDKGGNSRILSELGAAIPKLREVNVRSTTLLNECLLVWTIRDLMKEIRVIMRLLKEISLLESTCDEARLREFCKWPTPIASPIFQPSPSSAGNGGALQYIPLDSSQHNAVSQSEGNLSLIPSPRFPSPRSPASPTDKDRKNAGVAEKNAGVGEKNAGVGDKNAGPVTQENVIGSKACSAQDSAERKLKGLDWPLQKMTQLQEALPPEMDPKSQRKELRKTILRLTREQEDRTRGANAEMLALAIAVLQKILDDRDCDVAARVGDLIKQSEVAVDQILAQERERQLTADVHRETRPKTAEHPPKVMDVVTTQLMEKMPAKIITAKGRAARLSLVFVPHVYIPNEKTRKSRPSSKDRHEATSSGITPPGVAG